jgi:transcription antitermination factor NusG
MQSSHENWYVLTHNSSCHQSLTEKIQTLGVEVYSPSRVTLRKRTDRPSSVRQELQLFPGYLLLRFDPQVTHPTDITALSAAHGFVRFGGDACVVQDSVVEKLKVAVQLRPNRGLDHADYRNLPSELERALHLIVDMRSEAARITAFTALLTQSAALQRLTGRAGSIVHSTLHPL